MTYEQNNLCDLKCYSASHEREETQWEHGYNTCIYLTWYRLKTGALEESFMSPKDRYPLSCRPIHTIQSCHMCQGELQLWRHLLQYNSVIHMLWSNSFEASKRTHTTVLRLAKPVTLPCNCSHKAIFVWPRSFLCPLQQTMTYKIQRKVCLQRIWELLWFQST